MANAGSDVEDGSWEEASDIFEVRPEVGESGPEETEAPDSNAGSATIVGEPPVSETNSRQSRYRTPPGAANAPVPARRRIGTGSRGEEDSRESSAKWLENSCPPPRRIPRRLPRENWSPYLPPAPNATKSERLNIKPPKFEDKDSCVESHLALFEIIARRNRWDDSEKADYLKCSLTGESSVT